MKVTKTKFEGLLIFNTPKHKDNRGYLREVIIEKNIKQKFKFQIISKSKKNVLRGMHFQLKKPQGKFLSVFKGKILDVVVDLRKKSKTFGKYFAVILSEDNCKSIYIPPGFAHGFYAIEKENIVNYSCTEYRSKKDECGLSWNDKTINIKWPRKKIIISKKDKKNLSFEEVVKLIK